jgi:5-methylcytosine-specific restriction endonuclease McrA
MTQKYDWPKIGDRFGTLVVQEIYSFSKNGKKDGNRIRLLCDCGAEVKNKVAYQLVRDDGIRGCAKCMSKKRGKAKRIYSDGQARHHVYFNYINGAKRRNIEWGLSRDDFFKYANGECVYCGEKDLSFFNAPKTSPWQEKYLYTGVDRIDSSFGYVEGNVQTCCMWCNRAKSTMSEQEFFAWIKKIVDKNPERL